MTLREETRRAIADAAKDKTVKQLELYFRISSSTVYAVLKEFGVKLLTPKELLKR